MNNIHCVVVMLMASVGWRCAFKTAVALFPAYSSLSGLLSRGAQHVTTTDSVMDCFGELLRSMINDLKRDPS